MKKRLIDANALLASDIYYDHCKCLIPRYEVENAPTVDAVKVSDKRIEKVIRLIESEYERALKLEYIRNPLAFALYRVWKKIDGERRSDG